MIDSTNYWRKWCPFCNSPNIETVALLTQGEVTRLNSRFRLKETQEYTPADYNRCANCERVFLANNTRWAHDRKAMRRDCVRPGKLLAKKGGG